MEDLVITLFSSCNGKDNKQNGCSKQLTVAVISVSFDTCISSQTEVFIGASLSVVDVEFIFDGM